MKRIVGIIRDYAMPFLKKAGIFNATLEAFTAFKAAKGNALLFVFRRLPIHKRTIVFSSFYGEQYNGAPKMISDALKGKECEIIWVLPSEDLSNRECKTVRQRSLKYYYTIATAAVWVDNCRKDYWIKKRKEQLYIQTWHGPVCIKAVEKDAEDTLDPVYLRNARNDSKIADYIVAESEWRKHNILNSFWYNGKIIEGEFKNYTYINEDTAVSEVKKFYGIPDNSRLLIYLPTFRNDESVDQYFDQYDNLIAQLKNRTGNDWRVIIRMHPNVSRKANSIHYDNYVFNGTQFQSAETLIYAADLILTDYSGCIFEGFRAKKRVVLFAKDYDSYISGNRSMYFDVSKLPAPMARDEEQLYRIIDEFDDECYEKARQEFISSLGYYGNDATIICTDLIEHHMEKKEMK